MFDYRFELMTKLVFPTILLNHKLNHHKIPALVCPVAEDRITKGQDFG